MSNKQFEDLQFLGERSRQRYLESVDWLATRKVTHGKAIPQADLDKIQKARDEISEIRDAVTYADISHLTITFT